MAHQSPLREQHLQAEATLTPYGPLTPPVELVESFGEVDFEYAAIRKACALIDAPHRATLEIAGDERREFLNNMVTQEIGGLEPFRSRRAFWLSRKGRIVSDLRITELGDRMLVDLDVHAADETIESLGSYVIMEDVEIRDITDRVHRLALHGPTAPLLLSEIGEQSGEDDDGPPVGELKEDAACCVHIGGAAVMVERQDFAGEIGLELTMPVDEAPSVYRALVESGSPTNGGVAGSLQARVGLRQAGWLALNTARIEAGRPVMFADFSTDSLPAECGEETLRDRVSFTKGCFLGQEVVARMQHLGKPKRTLVALRPEGEPPRDDEGHAVQPIGGANVATEENPDDPIGGVTSSTISPMLGGLPICFAVLKTDAAVDGAILRVPCEGRIGRFRVQKSLPFYGRG